MTDLIPKYLFEEKEYQRNELLEIFKKIEEIEGYFEDLLEKLIENKIIIKINNKRDKYSVKFVGIFSTVFEDKTTVIVVLPKYLDNKTELKSPKYTTEYTTLLIGLFRKYFRKKQNASKKEIDLNKVDSRSKNNSFDLTAIIDYLIGDYLSYGLYENTIEGIEYNGNGAIDWGRSITEETPLMMNRQVIYPDFFTRIEVNEENNFIRRIHQNIIYECFEHFKKYSFLKILGYPSLTLPPPPKLMENIKYQTKCIELELKNTYSDRKITLLTAIKNYLQTEKVSTIQKKSLLYGRHAFHTIWEEACSSIFRNDFKIYEESLPHPEWSSYDPENLNQETPTLKPDIVRMIEDQMIILDAKYYNYPFNSDGKIIYGVPKLEDISKQYLYIKALKKINKKPKPSSYHNAFLIPVADKNNEHPKKIGYVDFPIFDNLPKIMVVTLPAKKIFEMYINGKVYTEAELEDYVDKYFKDK